MGPKVSHFGEVLSKATGLNIAVPKSFYPQLLLLAGVTEVLGAILALLGIKAGSTLLILFLVPTSVSVAWQR
jgi:hypothetical protein